MICLGILWNGMDTYKEEVITDISKYGTIIDYFSIDLSENYENFVRDIYAQDDIAQWKVERKLETMFSCSTSRTVTIVLVKVETTQSEYHPLKKRMVYTNLENMKIAIRQKYKELINPYFFDNIFHATDDETEFKNDYEIVKKYANKEIKTSQKRKNLNKDVK